MATDRFVCDILRCVMRISLDFVLVCSQSAMQNRDEIRFVMWCKKWCKKCALFLGMLFQTFSPIDVLDMVARRSLLFPLIVARQPRAIASSTAAKSLPYLFPACGNRGDQA